MNLTIPRLVFVWLTIGVLTSAIPAIAQETRADVIAEEQAEKEKRLRPYEPSRAERIISRAMRGFTAPPSGFYPTFGSVYSGGGAALGPGYRRYYGDRSTLDARALYSIKSYKLAEVGTQSPGHAGGRVDVYARTRWLDATQVSFYGLGPNSSTDDRTKFRLREGSAIGGIRTRPLPWLVFGAALSFEDFTTSAPGPATDATYVHSTASAGIDWRPSAGYARRGGLYALEYHNYADRSDTFGFDRIDAEVVQHFPILRENWVLSFHAALQTTLGDDVIPYFMLPSIGSGSTLRGYGSWRFRDRHSELFSAEWRWIPNRLGLDMALFYDVGKVASRRSDLDFDGLKSDVGIGVRLHGPAATPVRVELAHGSDGLRVVFSGGPAF